MHQLVKSTDALTKAWMAHLSSSELAFRALAASLGGRSQMDPYGDDPHDPPPPRNKVPYDPNFITLLYLGLNDQWQVDVNHASYPIAGGSTVDGRRDKAVEILADKVARNVTFGGQALPNHTPYRRLHPIDPLRPLDSGSFSDFKFLNQNEIFIYLHHPNINLQMYEYRLLGFKMQGAGDAELKYPNDTFYNARLVPAAEMPGLVDGTMLRVENHVTFDFKPLPANVAHDYSMDIKIQVEGGAAGWITLIIDPDTGNGLGYEP